MDDKVVESGADFVWLGGGATNSVRFFDVTFAGSAVRLGGVFLATLGATSRAGSGCDSSWGDCVFFAELVGGGSDSVVLNFRFGRDGFFALNSEIRTSGGARSEKDVESRSDGAFFFSEVRNLSAAPVGRTRAGGLGEFSLVMADSPSRVRFCGTADC